jgi:hypothetical protein
MILQQIVDHKREELAAVKRRVALADLRAKVPDIPPARDLCPLPGWSYRQMD